MRIVLQNERASKAGIPLFSCGPLDHSATENTIPPTKQVQKLIDRVGAVGHVTPSAPGAKGFIASKIAAENAGDYRDPRQVDAWAAEIGEFLRDVPARP